VEPAAPIELPAAFVDEPVVSAAEQHQVCERGRPASRPVVDVMRIEAVFAARETATGVPGP
jgi:hypothetical protein